jgi:hypothetical protein
LELRGNLFLHVTLLAVVDWAVRSVAHAAVVLLESPGAPLKG